MGCFKSNYNIIATALFVFIFEQKTTKALLNDFCI